jgi:protease-4
MTWGQRRAIVIIVLAVFLVILCIVAAKPGRTTLRLPSNAVLVIDAAGQIEEQRAPDFFSAFNGFTVPVLHDYVDAIDAAAKDSHITGLVVRIAPLETGWGKLEEIRSHLFAFRKSGKPSICYLGYDGIGNPEYYLASACQQIWLVPTAPVSIRGMMAQAIFFRGTLDKLKVVPEFYHIADSRPPATPSPKNSLLPRIRKKSRACCTVSTINI